MHFLEHRVEPREALQLPLKVHECEGIEAVTRDISTSGMYFEIRGDHQLDSNVLLEMNLEEAGMKFTAQGRIVRIEHRDGCTGVAVRLISPKLQTLD